MNYTMEFHEKIRELRKQKGLTQDELAELLYVSRTAISKWESGRGFPNLESLKALSSFFEVSIDDLLSGDEILAIAEDDCKKRQMRIRDLVFGLLDCSFMLLLFLPIFGQQAGGMIQQAAVVTMTGLQSYLKASYVILILIVSLFGILTLALQNCQREFWLNNKARISVILCIASVSLFILSRQAYAALCALAYLIVKAMILINK